MNGFSPESPEDNNGISVRVLELERKQGYLEDCKNIYHNSIENYQAALVQNEMAKARRTNTRGSKRELECDGCTSRWCTICELEKASKLMIVAGDNVEWTKVELEVIQEEINTRRVTNAARLQAFQRVRRQMEEVAAEAAAEVAAEAGASTNNNNEDVKEEPEVKDEADVKTEPDDGNYPTIGMTNNVKSEPMDSADHSTTDESSSDDGTGSEDESSSDNSDASDNSDDDDQSNTDYSTSDEDMDETPSNGLNLL